jgi:hypothetical protein
MLTVKNNIKFPKQFVFKEDLEFIANRIFVPTLQLNIDKQVAIDGSALKPNDPKYTARKIRKGLSAKILIATGKLRSDFIVLNKGLSTVVVTIHPERKAIGGYLVQMGKNFFGISTSMERNAIKYMKDKIKAVINGTKPA